MRGPTSTTLLRGRLVLADDVVDDAVVELADGRVRDVRAVRPGDPAALGTLLPGLVDVHCHGGGGASLASTDTDETAAAAAWHVRRGTTGVVASLVTDEVDRMLAHCAALARLRGRDQDGAVLGVHLEGPFLAPSRRGAHPAGLVLAPDPGLMGALLAAGAGHVRQVTLAPELPGYPALAAAVRDAGAVVALGHSDADHATAAAAFEAGARSTTHLFNAMRPWGHRSSSLASAALAAAARTRAVVELVADGTHVDAGTAAAVMALVPGQVALVSDAVPPAGLPDGGHVLGALRVQVRDGVVRTEDGAIAGGSGSLLDVVRFAVQQAGVPLAVAVAAASRVPAALLGLDRAAGVGRLAPGSRADVLVVDDDLRATQVWRGGRPVPLG